MTFKEAYKEMLKGKKVRRPGFVNPWYIEQDKIVIKLKSGKVLEVPLNTVTIVDMNSNDWEVVEENKESKVWKPEKDGHYCYYNDTGHVYESCYDGDSTDKNRLEFGNCFKTKEEASHMIEKLKVINELKNFALENNDKDVDWRDKCTTKYFISYDFDDEKIQFVGYTFRNFLPFEIYFTSREIARKAIKKIGEYRIKKYYFDIEE